MFDPTGEDPLDLMDRWINEAGEAEINDPGAVALATVADDDFPSVRMVLFKGRDAEGVHFYTNLTSRKARELESNPKAALCFHWKSLRRQIRLVGSVERLDDQSVDDYFTSRPYGSRIAAWASDQSSPLESREALEAEFEKFSKEYPENPPRPPFWGGYRLIPHEIEFWMNGEQRLHDRFHFVKADGVWSSGRLAP
jgi:pyridoxamine 5'-phosphate oxidase